MSNLGDQAIDDRSLEQRRFIAAHGGNGDTHDQPAAVRVRSDPVG